MFSRNLFTLGRFSLRSIKQNNLTPFVYCSTVLNEASKHEVPRPLENSSAYNYLKSHPNYKETFVDLNSLAAYNLEGTALSLFGSYALKGTDFRNSDFDTNVVDFIITQIPNLNDEELKILLFLTTLPANLPNEKETNFRRFWKRLDDECFLRSKTWTYNEMFAVCELWYLNKLCRVTEFHWALVKKMFRKCEKLSTVEFIRFLFSLNLVRQIPESINTYELEHCLVKHIDAISATEASIAAMAFFKTKTPIRDYELFRKFMELIMSESSSLDSVFVSAVAKVGRLSGRGKTSAILYSFQEAFLQEVDRLNLTSAMHLAIIGTRTFVSHEPILCTVLRKAEADLPNMRLKDMERLLLALTMFHINCDSFCRGVIKELKSPNRELEFSKFGKLLPSILFYISMRKIYPYDLINQVLDTNFLMQYFGRNMQKYQREILCLDFGVGLDCPDYKGKRLDEKIRKSVTRLNLLWLWPDAHEKVSAYEHSVRTAAEYVSKTLGGKQYVHTCNVLPQFHSAELVFFLDKNNRPTGVPEAFKNLENHLVKYVPNDLPVGVVPHAVLVCGYNSVIRNKPRTLLGQLKLQQEQLGKIGYKVHVVFPEDINFERNETDEMRRQRTEFFRKLVFES